MAPVRNVVVCCDGTWNSPENKDGELPAPTNVVRLHAEVETSAQKAGIEQVAYYRSGVGTAGNKIKRVIGGAFGRGLDDDIRSAYKWLTETVREGDRLYIFGFSRGAYTVRSLGGLLASVGLVDMTGDQPDAMKWRLTNHALEAYRNAKRRLARQEEQKLSEEDAALFAENRHKSHDGAIHFMGVWDTVGALGIPPDLGLVRSLLMRDPHKYQFHDTRLGNGVHHARHAVALDEKRLDFTPTLWTLPDDRPADTHSFSQMWFAGVHGDVGGGYFHRGLGDVTLEWMMDEAVGQGLVMREGAREVLEADPQGLLHNSYVGGFARRPSRPRSAPNLADHEGQKTTISPRLLDRIRRPAPGEVSYWGTVDLQPGESVQVPVAAREKWNWTGVFIRAEGAYDFEARGEWLDASLKGDADGIYRGFNWRKVFYPVAQAPGARRIWGKRCKVAPWFSLVGAVGNGRGVDEETKSALEHETFLIGKKREAFSPEREGGYLYAFANDAWPRYGNNRGTLRLTVTRRS